MILLDLKGAALEPDRVLRLDREVDRLNLYGHTALYTLPEGQDLSKQWRGQFICGYKVSCRILWISCLWLCLPFKFQIPCCQHRVEEKSAEPLLFD